MVSGRSCMGIQPDNHHRRQMEQQPWNNRSTTVRKRRSLGYTCGGNLSWTAALVLAMCLAVSPIGNFAVAGETLDVCDDDASNPGACSNPHSSSSSSSSSDKTKNNACRLYMAPTTVGGIEGNYGIFTSVDLPKGATVLSNDGPNIPVLHDDRRSPTAFPDTNHIGLFDNVWWGWTAEVSDQLRAEMDADHKGLMAIVDLQINFGALPNCHPYRSNLETRQPADGIDYDDRRYLGSHDDHSRSPLRGSFSYYTGKHYLVQKSVDAGTELFLDYERDWEQHGFPRRQDYFSAAALVRKWITKVDELVQQASQKDDRIAFDRRVYQTLDPTEVYPVETVVDGVAALLELIRVPKPEDVPLDDVGYQSFTGSDQDKAEKGVYHLEQLTSRVLSVIPKTAEDWNRAFAKSWEIYLDRMMGILEEVLDSEEAPEVSTPNEELAGAMPGLPSVKDVADALYEVSKPPPKSIEELEATGICLDNIVAGHSQTPLELEGSPGEGSSSSNFTIGRGAMASRSLAKGDLIVPVPFIHLLDRSLFEAVPEDKLDEGEHGIDELILNYCFGHSESTMVLCPVTNAVLINHCSDRNGRFPCGGGTHQGPNAEYRWASESDWDRKTKTTLTMGLDEMAATDHLQQHRMLSMEIVATRDIREGEEIFIDYGEKWEEAWLEHVRNWSKEDDDVKPSWASSLTSFELNHKDLLEAGDGKNGTDPLFYGDLRDDRAATSDDGRFMAMCWYQDMIDREYGLGSRHSLVPVDKEKLDKEEVDSDSNIYWKDLTDEEIFSEYAIGVGPNSTMDGFTHLRDNVPGTAECFWPCSILAKKIDGLIEGDEERYVVRIFPSPYHIYVDGKEEYEDAATDLLLKNFPRSSIRFVTTPYQGDQYHPKTFRHHIEIKDELFPEEWKNKK